MFANPSAFSRDLSALSTEKPQFRAGDDDGLIARPVVSKPDSRAAQLASKGEIDDSMDNRFALASMHALTTLSRRQRAAGDQMIAPQRARFGEDHQPATQRGPTAYAADASPTFGGRRTARTNLTRLLESAAASARDTTANPDATHDPAALPDPLAVDAAAALMCSFGSDVLLRRGVGPADIIARRANVGSRSAGGGIWIGADAGGGDDGPDEEDVDVSSSSVDAPRDGDRDGRLRPLRPKGVPPRGASDSHGRAGSAMDRSASVARGFGRSEPSVARSRGGQAGSHAASREGSRRRGDDEADVDGAQRDGDADGDADEEERRLARAGSDDLAPSGYWKEGAGDEGGVRSRGASSRRSRAEGGRENEVPGTPDRDDGAASHRSGNDGWGAPVRGASAASGGSGGADGGARGSKPPSRTGSWSAQSPAADGWGSPAKDDDETPPPSTPPPDDAPQDGWGSPAKGSDGGDSPRVESAGPSPRRGEEKDGWGTPAASARGGGSISPASREGSVARLSESKLSPGQPDQEQKESEGGLSDLLNDKEDRFSDV